MYQPVLVLRTAAVALPERTGDLGRDLAARRRHAREVRWVAARDHLRDGILDEAGRRAWTRGGRRSGIVFLRGTEVFLPHPAPGEISPTCALGGGGLSAWLDGLLRACSGRRTRVDIDGERFELTPTSDGIILTAHDIDGTEEARILVDASRLPQRLTEIRQAADAVERA